MHVHLRYFAIIRETLGRGEEHRPIAPGTTVAALFDQLATEQPRLGPMRAATLVMVNHEYVPHDYVLRDGDEVALIPPVSGGAAHHVRIQTAPLDARAVESFVADASAGAIVTFTGTVRDHARGRGVSQLEYEAYVPAAEAMLARIGEEIATRWGIERVAIVHRVGSLEVGEASVVIAVASPHRDEAFAACRHAIERIKEIVPIWKKEHYADGAVWIGSEAEYQREVGSRAAGAEATTEE